MNRFFSVVAATTVVVSIQATANAQSGAQGVLRLPDNVTSITSVDAHNLIILETQESSELDDAPRQYSLYVPRHIYSGALARLFGGTVIPSELLISPGTAGRSGFSAPGALTPMFNNGINNGFNNGAVNNGFNNNNANSGFPTYPQPAQTFIR